MRRELSGVSWGAGVVEVASDSLRTGLDVKLFVDAADVSADGSETNTEFIAYLFDQESLSEQIEHFGFALGEFDGFVARFG